MLNSSYHHLLTTSKIDVFSLDQITNGLTLKFLASFWTFVVIRDRMYFHNLIVINYYTLYREGLFAQSTVQLLI